MKTAVFGMALIGAVIATESRADNGVDLYNHCGKAVAGFFNGATCANFINGILGGIETAPHPQICFPRSFDNRQAVPIVRAFMRNHPEQLSYSEPEVIRRAFRDAFPCP